MTVVHRELQLLRADATRNRSYSQERDRKLKAAGRGFDRAQRQLAKIEELM